MYLSLKIYVCMEFDMILIILISITKRPDIDTYKFKILWSHDLYAFPIKRQSSIDMSWSSPGHDLVPSLSLVECLFSNMAYPVNVLVQQRAS